MGTTTSTEVLSQSEPQNPVVEHGHFGVTVSTDKALAAVELSADEKIRQAYEQGKADASAEFQNVFSSVAAQVYENVQQELTAMQNRHIEESKELVSSSNRFFNCGDGFVFVSLTTFSSS